MTGQAGALGCAYFQQRRWVHRRRRQRHPPAAGRIPSTSALDFSYWWCRIIVNQELRVELRIFTLEQEIERHTGVVINGERAADDPMEQPKRKAADEPRFPTPPPPPAPPSTTSSFFHAAPNSSSAALWQPTEQHQASAEHDLANRLNALSAQIEQATYEQRKANDLLPERLLQSRKAREEEDAAARVERITQGLVATEFANQVMEQLTTPLLDRIQQAAPNPSPTENAAASRVPPTATLNEDDGTWNKRQITYVFHLGLAVGLLFLVRPFMPGGCEGWLLAAFAMTWGIGSIGLPAGMFGTTRLEKNCSRFTAQVVSLSFSLMVIYSAYLLVFPAVNADGAHASTSPSPSPSPSDDDVCFWRVVFGIIGSVVTLGHIGCSIMMTDSKWKGDEETSKRWSKGTRMICCMCP
ncbi:hypothetical protein EJB05_02675, partial [Eragrostis curvula]